MRLLALMVLLTPSVATAMDLHTQCLGEGVEVRFTVSSEPWADDWVGTVFTRRVLGGEWEEISDLIPRTAPESQAYFVDTQADPGVMYEYSARAVTGTGSPLDPPGEDGVGWRPYVHCNGPLLLGVVRVVDPATNLVEWDADACANVGWQIGSLSTNLPCISPLQPAVGDLVAVFGDTYWDYDWWQTEVYFCSSASCPVANQADSFGTIKARF